MTFTKTFGSYSSSPSSTQSPKSTLWSTNSWHIHLSMSPWHCFKSTSTSDQLRPCCCQMIYTNILLWYQLNIILMRQLVWLKCMDVFSALLSNQHITIDNAVLSMPHMSCSKKMSWNCILDLATGTLMVCGRYGQSARQLALIWDKVLTKLVLLI